MLKEYVETSLSAEEIGDLLTMTGFELEEIIEVQGEPVLDVNIMANRGDGASVLGMAREVLAKDESAQATDLFVRAKQHFPAQDQSERVDATIRIETPNCTRYACRIFRNVQNGASPDWLVKRLDQCGQRSISLLVDLTNYVMLEVGQPLHAFDLDKLGRTVVVRQAREGETFRTLDGSDHELTPECMMICDAEKPVAAAGVMGGEATEVSASTKDCLLESAHFSPQTVRRTKNILGIKTEASYRFERWVDPEGVVAALNRFAELYEQITGLKCEPGAADSYPGRGQSRTLSLRASRASKIMGMELSPEVCESALNRLGFKASRNGDLISCTIPSWRADVHREEDLIEEVGRIYGYEKIPEAAPAGSVTPGGSVGVEAFSERVRDVLLRSGIHEVLTHTLRGESLLDSGEAKVRVRTPHSPEIAWLRDSMLPGLSDCALRNGGRSIQIFEIGQTFRQGSETTQLGILMTGALDAATWCGQKSPQADFFTLKGVIEKLSQGLNLPVKVSPREGDPRFHPTRCATIGDAGVFGQIHPDIQESLGFPEPVLMAEIDLGKLMDMALDIPKLKSISRNPSIRRDIAVLVDKSVPYSSLEEAIQSSGGDVLERHWLFDVYEGKGVPEGKHSLAIAFQLRKMDGTFTDDEANQVRDRIVAGLAQVGATPR